ERHTCQGAVGETPTPRGFVRPCRRRDRSGDDKCQRNLPHRSFHLLRIPSAFGTRFDSVKEQDESQHALWWSGGEKPMTQAHFVPSRSAPHPGTPASDCDIPVAGSSCLHIIVK